MAERVILEATGTEVRHGQMVRCVTGPHRGTTWRFHALQRTAEGHRVEVSRDTRAGRIHRSFHPGMFGLSVSVEIAWTRAAVAKVVSARRKVDDYMLAGVLSLLPLAAFEHWHLADRLFELIGNSEH